MRQQRFHVTVNQIYNNIFFFFISKKEILLFIKISPYPGEKGFIVRTPRQRRNRTCGCTVVVADFRILFVMKKLLIELNN